jgi:hypothetical protein
VGPVTPIVPPVAPIVNPGPAPETPKQEQPPRGATNLTAEDVAALEEMIIKSDINFDS